MLIFEYTDTEKCYGTSNKLFMQLLKSKARCKRGVSEGRKDKTLPGGLKRVKGA